MTSRITALVREKTTAINLQADNIENNLFHDLNQFRGIASIISRDTDVLRVLSLFGAGTYPKSLTIERRKAVWSKNAQLKTLSSYLNLVNASLGSDVVYIINASGDCIASSNADKPDSFVGSNYVSREYFRVAMEGKPWHQYAMGKVSNIPGLFFSVPVVNAGQIVGVVIAKINLSELSQWVNLENAFITDQYGVIILASDAKLEMHALPDAAIVGLASEARRNRYKREEFPVVAIKPWPGQLNASLLSFDEENHPVILTDRMLAKDDINIYVLRRIPEIAAMAEQQLILFILLAISGSLAIIFIGSRIAFEHIRKQAELRLRNSEESLKESQIIAGLGSYVLDVQAGLWESSDMLDDLLGIDKTHDHSVSAWQASIHPDDRAMMTDYFKNEVLGQRKVFDREYRIIRQNDQAVRWVHGLGKLLFDSQGHPLKMLGTIQDITERKQMEIELHESEKRYRNLVETTIDLVWAVDANAVYTYASPRAYAITGYQPAELIGTTPFDLMAPEEAKRVARLFTSLVAAQQPMINLENTRLHKDGHPIVFESSGVPFLDADGKLCGYRGIDRDITERKQAEQTAMDERNFSNTLIASQPDIFYVLDPTGRFVRWNKKLTEILGLSDTQLAVTNALAVIHEEDRPAVAEKIQEAFEQGAVTIDARLITQMGNRDYVFNATSVETAKGKHLIGVGTDITERKQAAQALTDSEAISRSVMTAAMDAILMIDDRGVIVSWNPASERMLGYSSHEAIGRDAHELFVPSRYHADFRKGFATFLETGTGAVIGKTREVEALRKDGSEFSVELSISAIRLNERWHAVGILRDMTERRLVEVEVQKLQEKLREQALHDPLTGLYNRRYLDETVARELARAARNKQPVGIVMCDLDHFKLVNDTHGHMAGDEVLRMFAELLKKHARGSDIVCRFGGEEFVMFLPDMTPAVVYQRAEQLRTELAAKRITLGEAVIQVTASFGVATFPENGKRMDSLISAVDTAMYQAKEAGRDRVVVSLVHEADVPERR